MTGRSHGVWLRVLVAVAGALALLAAEAGAQAPVTARGQYRAFWVDTFNTRFATPADVGTIVARAELARANTLFVQVRRRGDAWYLDSREPLAEGIAFAAAFDPLRELLARAHAVGVAVHAVVTVGPIWNQPVAPASPTHVFAVHGFTPAGPVPGRQNWLTRTRPTDATPASAFGGFRFGLDFWLDPGHPDAAAYTVDVLTHLVAQYKIDGLHLDALRYPEAIATEAAGQPEPSVGYNEISLERFRRRYGLAADAMPAPNDGAWNDWRRAQVTALLGRITLAALAVRPSLVVSAGVAATGDAPVVGSGPPGGAADALAWSASEPFRHAFQDWYHWSEDGLVDVLVPLVYRPEHTLAGAEDFAGWVRWAREHTGGRQLIVGFGAYLNSVEGTLRQLRRATAQPLAAGDPPAADGVVVFSMGAHNAPVAQNPLAVSGTRDTPYRAFDELASGLVTGRTTVGQLLEPASPPPLFADPAAVPIPSWKTAPTTGHLRGAITVARADGSRVAADGAAVSLEWDAGDRALPGAVPPTPPAVPAVSPADGGGVYGRFDLAPGRYRVLVAPIGDGVYRSACTVTIAAGLVATLDLSVDPSRPAVATCTTP